MTIRIPKPVLVALALLLIGGTAVGAFLIGHSSGEDQGDAARTDNARTEEPATSLECSRAEFEEAVGGSQLEEHAREIYSPPGALISKPSGFGISHLECADLDGDGIEEMLGALATGASFRTTIYGIFRPGPSDWELAFLRDGFVISDLEVRGESVVEEVPTFGVDDPLCCPSGFRSNRVLAAGEEFKVVLGGVARDRGLAISEQQGATELGPLDLQQAGPSQATAAFGAPTSALSGDLGEQISELCDYSWADLGLEISFVHLGGADACGRGLVQSFELRGTAAEQAAWQTADGVRVGMSQRELAKLYPFVDELRPGATAELIQRYSEIGGGGFQDLLLAKLEDGEVTSLSSFVGSAGE